MSAYFLQLVEACCLSDLKMINSSGSSACCWKPSQQAEWALLQNLPRLLSMRTLSPLFNNVRPSSLSMPDIMMCAPSHLSPLYISL